MYVFADKITQFRWQDLDEKHGTLHVWEDDDEAARLVLFTDDDSGRTYILVDQNITSTERQRMQPGAGASLPAMGWSAAGLM